MLFFSCSACCRHWEGSFRASVGCRFPHLELLEMLPLVAGTWAQAMGCSARHIGSFRLLTETVNGGFH